MTTEEIIQKTLELKQCTVDLHAVAEKMKEKNNEYKKGCLDRTREEQLRLESHVLLDQFLDVAYRGNYICKEIDDAIEGR